MKALVLFLALACANLLGHADTIQITLGGYFDLTGHDEAPLSASDIDPFDSSISTTLENPYSLTLTYDSNAQPSSFGIYPAGANTLHFGDYSETGTSGQIFSGPGLNIFSSSFVIPGGTQYNSTIHLFATGSEYFPFSLLQSFSTWQLAFPSDFALQTSGLQVADGLFGPVTSFSAVDLSVPEPSTVAFLLLGFGLAWFPFRKLASLQISR